MASLMDHASIRVTAGNGGAGSHAMRREPYVPRGGPYGGDGGKGGDVVLEASESQRTLIDFSFQSVFEAETGLNGGTQRMHGRGGKDLILKVPPGTLVREAQSGELLGDLIQAGQRLIIAKGGRGGRGNVHFKTSTRQAPTMAEKGEPGEEREIRLELKLLADVALLGFPNAGKSTLLSRISAAKPKIANYPFTTLEPQLGVVRLGEERSFIVADLPGLIEGASEGKGLGFRFLRHIERTRVLLYLLDGAASEERDLWKDYGILKKELKNYHPGLSKLPKLAALSKADLSETQAAFKKLKTKFAKEKTPFYLISSAAGHGIETLLLELYKRVQKAPDSLIAQEGESEQVREKLYQPAPRFILREDDRGWILEGREPVKWVAMTDFNNDEAVARLKRIFKRIGVAKALVEAGIREGEAIRVGKEVMIYEP